MLSFYPSNFIEYSFLSASLSLTLCLIIEFSFFMVCFGLTLCLIILYITSILSKHITSTLTDIKNHIIKCNETALAIVMSIIFSPKNLLK